MGRQISSRTEKGPAVVTSRVPASGLAHTRLKPDDGICLCYTKESAGTVREIVTALHKRRTVDAAGCRPAASTVLEIFHLFFHREINRCWPGFRGIGGI